MLLERINQILLHENCSPKSLFFYQPEYKILFDITSEISKLVSFADYIYRQKTKVTILFNF